MTVKVSARGAERWKQGHPWIYRSDVAEQPDKKPGIVSVTDRKGKFLGQALYSPSSEIRLRLLTRSEEAMKTVLQPEGILLRNDAAVRRHEGLPSEVVLASGQVPEAVEVVEDGVKYLAAPWGGQKTGAFLDQRENRILVGRHTRAGGRALDLFAYHGSFALHLARHAKEVVAVDQSAEALARGAENARLNGIGNIEWREANTFDLLRELERRREPFDTIVLDPPAFAKTRANLERAVAGYKEINLRAMKVLAPGGVLFTSSCSD